MSEEIKSQSTPQEVSETPVTAETPAEPPAPRPRRDRSQQRRREQSAIRYIAILFAAAFVLLLFTFVMERRQYEMLNAENQEQIENLQQNVSAVQSLKNLYAENDELKERVAELEAELQDTVKARQEERTQHYQEQETSDKTILALEWFWQIDEAYARGRNTLCRQLIQTFEAAGLEDYLPKENHTGTDRYSPYDRYQEIYDRLH